MTDYFMSLTRHLNAYVYETMKIVFVFTLCAFLSTALNLPTTTADLSANVQNSCRSLFHKSMRSSQIVEAYLCGADLPEGQTREIFIQTSLYHLIVVSGSHLTALMLLLQTLGVRSFLFQFLASLGLSFLTGLQAPIVRALCQFSLSRLNSYFQWHWKGLQKLIWGSFLALAVFPQWINSLSFQLSLGACLSLNASHLLLEGKTIHPLKGACITYVLLLPLLWGWGQLHPLGILTNLFLAPALGLILWFLCFLWIIFPSLADSGIELTLRILQEIAQFIPLVQTADSFSMLCRWVYLLFLIGLLWGQQIHRERNR